MNATNVKLAIGLVLVTVWFALIVLHGFFPQIDGADLIANIKIALIGLGAYHIGDRAVPAESPRPTIDVPPLR